MLADAVAGAMGQHDVPPGIGKSFPERPDVAAGHDHVVEPDGLAVFPILFRRVAFVEDAPGSAAMATAAWDTSSRIASRPGRAFVFMGLPECRSDGASTMRESLNQFANSSDAPGVLRTSLRVRQVLVSRMRHPDDPVVVSINPTDDLVSIQSID